MSGKNVLVTGANGHVGYTLTKILVERGYNVRASVRNKNDPKLESVLEHVGNYYEAYDRSFCDGTGAMANCLVDRAGTMNAPYWEGGLQYAPPMR